jgi:hypothetical protein
MQYVANRDEETREINFIARFSKTGLPEIWRDGKWVEQTSALIGMLHDGLLENITPVEAQNYIAKSKSKELQPI